MKKFAIILAALLLVLTAGCAIGQGNKPDGTPAPKLSKEEYPKIDGSTANIPLAVALAKQVLGIGDLEAEEMTQFNATSKAYENLANGDCDLLLVYEGSEETMAKLDGMGAKLDYYPIGRDALVFIANESNPVQNLSTKQIVDIYTGEITNWNQVGGKDEAIAAFQRNSTSGSQTMMEKLVMKGTPMMEAPSEFTPAEMGSLIDGLAEYNNSGAAIGYSVYYYASLMYSRPGLKFLGVDGTPPSNESIALGQYPFINEFFAVVRADEPANSPARQLVEWLRSADGQALVESCGYVPGTEKVQ